MSKKYLPTQPSRRRSRSSDALPKRSDRRQSSSGARKRVLRQQSKTGSQVQSPAPRSTPRPRKDPLERLIQPDPGRNQRQTATDAGVPPDAVLSLQQLQQRIEEDASLAIVRFEGPGTCPHCRQTVHRPWHVQLGNPPIDLYFCNTALAELKYLVNQIGDPRQG